MGPKLARWAPVAILLLLALHLRFQDLADVCIAGDEMHAIYFAATHSPREILTVYTVQDHSIPMALYAELLERTVGLDELGLRLPGIVCSVLLLLSPLLWVRRLGRGTAFVAVALQASWALAVYYSVTARPYAAAALSVTLGLWCWERWLRRGSTAWALGLAVSGALGIFTHLFCLFPIAALYLLALLGLRRGSMTWRRWLVGVGLIAALLALLLGPGLPGLIETRLAKTGRGSTSLALLWDAWVLLVGGLPSLAGLFLAATVAGAVLAVRDRALEDVGAVGAVALSVLGLVATRPDFDPFIWARYVFPASPVVALLCARGMWWACAAAWRATLPLHPALKLFGLVGACAAPVAFATERPHALAPLALLAVPVFTSFRARRAPEAAARPDAVAHLLWPLFVFVAVTRWSPLQLYAWPANPFRTGRAALHGEPKTRPSMFPRPYRLIAEDEDAEVLIEHPPLISWHFFGPYGRYAEVHGKRVRMGSYRNAFDAENGIDLRTVVDLADPEEVAESGASYLVVHLDFASELNEILHAQAEEQRVPTRPEELEAIRRTFGAPLFAGPRFELFDLRSSRKPAGHGGPR